MKKVLILSLAILMVAGVAMADVIGVFSDAAGTSCNGTIAMFVPTNSYVVHQTTGTTGSQFKVQDSTGLTQLGSTVTAPFLAIGTVYTDLSLAYTACLGGPSFMAVTLSHFSAVAPGPCLLMEVVAAPGKPYPITVNCNFAEIAATGGRFTYNGNDATCPCVEPNATEPSSWGKVKSLYR